MLCSAVVDLVLALAQRFGLLDEALLDVRRGALLHDIGKMGIPDSILLKPGPLTPDEWEVMRKHTTYADLLLSNIPYLHRAMDIPLYHHERWDGRGYPTGLSGVEIPLSARIFAVVDVWDALTHARPYHPPWHPAKARQLIRDGAGQHFDPDVVAAFLTLIEDVPD